MASDKSTTRFVPHSPGNDRATGTSGRREVPPAGDIQLSSPDGVDTGVSSIALNAGLSSGLNAPPGTFALGGAETDGDAEVMLRVKAGDEDAFGLLVQKYRRAMVHFMFRTTRTQAAAEDLAQEVFLRVYRSRQSYEASAKFTTWLYRIATNLAINHARDTKNERPENTVSVDAKNEETGQSFDLPDSSLTAEQNLVRRERMMAIRAKVLGLPEKQRTAVLMHKYQGLDYKQIAEVLKLSESATKSLLFRAYETLREQLKEFV
jgi:RNA polymerase sigma-70 factor (ECF subfamily)